MLLLITVAFSCIVAVTSSSIVSVSTGYSVSTSALQTLYNTCNGLSWLWLEESEYGPVWDFTMSLSSDSFLYDPCSTSSDNSGSDSSWVAWQGVTCSASPLACLSQSCHIVELSLPDYHLVGSLPPSLSALTGLQSLHLNSNELYGTMPSSLCLLSSLSHLNLHHNSLSGTIPHEITRLSQLQDLVLYNNEFTGPISDSLHELAGSLVNLNIEWNFLTGTLPSSLGQLSRLEQLWVYHNLLSGTIPAELGLLSALNYFWVNDNLLTGTLPPSLGGLSSLVYCCIDHNQLQGPLPPELGQLASLRTVHFDVNFLSGPIPPEMGQLTSVRFFSIIDNDLSGPLPSSLLDQMAFLNTFLLQGNQLSGPLDHVFTSPSLSLEALLRVDLSNNYFSGTLPDALFQLEYIRSIALSVNCFEGEVPESLCAAQHLEILSMDGLRAEKGCKSAVRLPLVSVEIFNTIGGTIPECIWSFRNLSSVHLSGNAFTGTLPGRVEARLRELSLSHNKLSGPLPEYTQTSMGHLEQLDLAYNKISGKVRMQADEVSANVRLSVNRLSGDISGETFEDVGYVDVLLGNLFECGHLPHNDEYFDDYVCGSSSLDLALLGMASSISFFWFAILLLFLLKYPRVHELHPALTRLHTRVSRQLRFLVFLKDAGGGAGAGAGLRIVGHDQPQNSRIIAFSGGLTEVTRFVYRLAALCVLVSVPVYSIKAFEVLRDDYRHSMYEDVFRWFLTFAYITGEIPVVFIIVGWTVVIAFCVWYVGWKFPVSSSDEAGAGANANSSANGGAGADQVRGDSLEKKKEGEGEGQECLVEQEGLPGSRDYVWKLKVIALFVINLAITITVNSSYVYSNTKDISAGWHLTIQLSLALFNYLYTLMVIPLLSKPIQDPAACIWFRLVLLILNNMVIPCAATAVTSPACFQGLFFDADERTSSYSYVVCDLFSVSENRCVSTNLKFIDIAPMTPPFIYNNQCSSVLLSYYIPVHIYVYSFQLILPFLFVSMFTRMQYTQIPTRLRNNMHAIMWPKYWAAQDQLCKEEPPGGEHTGDRGRGACIGDSEHPVSDQIQMLRANTIVTLDVLNSLLVLLTFGLCSPFLTALIAASVGVKLNMWVMLIGRFAFRFMPTHAQHGDGEGLPPLAPSSPPSSPGAPVFSKRTAVTSGSDSGSGSDSDRGSGSGGEGREGEDESLAAVHPLVALLSASLPSLGVVFRSTLWPLVYSSAFFVSMLCWDLGADEVGFLRSMWAPLAVTALCCLLKQAEQVAWLRTKINLPPLAPPSSASPHRDSTSTSTRQDEAARVVKVLGAETSNPLNSSPSNHSGVGGDASIAKHMDLL